MLTLDRRTLLRAGTAAAVAATAGLAAPAQARAPLAGKQTAGFYRLKIGSIEVTVLSDGSVAFPADFLWAAPPADITAALSADFLPSAPAVAQLNTILVNTGDKLVLIDSGTGGKFQNTSGRLLANLAAAGYAPADIDTVLFTHFHPDHLWGISDAKNAALLFPSAEFVASETEIGFWGASELPGKVPEGMKAMVEATQGTMSLTKGRLRGIKAGAEVVPGLNTIDTPGHTPGHMSIHIGSGDADLIVTGDVVFNPAVTFRHPDWPVGFDMDKEMAAKTRKAFLDRVSADKTLIAGYHLPFPALGHVARDGNAYRYVPADWRWVD